MSDKILEIRDLLEKYHQCYREFHDLQLRERDLLASLEIEALEANNKRKETVALEIKMMEESRLRLAETIAMEHEVDVSVVNFSYLAEHCDPVYRVDFEKFAREFRTLARDLERITQTNRKLVQSSLNTARNLERVLHKLISDNATYLPTGEMELLTRGARLMQQTL